MRVRRRFGAGLDWSKVAAAWGRVWDRLQGKRPSGLGLGPSVSRDPTLPAQGPRPRAQGRFPTREYWLLAAGLAASTIVVGYIIAATMFFPAPIFASSHGVPNVRGQPLEEAVAALEQAGFVVNTSDDRVSHASVPPGAVVSQDPPPEMMAPEGTEVELILSGGPQRVPVPDVGGYDAALARTLIESAGLTVGSVEQTQAPTPENVAVNTRPPAGATLLPGSRITLVVSVGAPTIRVPELLGLSVDSARVLLEARGLALGDNYYQANSSVAPGTVFFQNPAGGTLTAPGTPVSVRIARENQ